tara:strand:- start:7989 stop:9488 length:1500 start_codon:yes stop_codon:yes gene_type:complete
MPSKKLNFSVSPINDNPTVVSGTTVINGFSHKNGFPTIKFSIPSQDMLLDTKSLRLSGQLIVKNATGAIQTTASGAYASYDTQNGAGLPASQAVNTSNWNGVSSLIDKLTIQSKKSQVELSNIINYSMYNALKKGMSYDDDDYKQTPLFRDLASGNNHGDVCRHLISSAVPADCLMGDIGDKHMGQFFSMDLDVPMLKSVPLHLGNAYLGGLLLNITLNSDASVIHSRHRSIDTAQQPNADPTGFSYCLKNIKLEGKLLVPTADDLKDYPSVLPLPSSVNLENDLHSSVNANTYTPQLSMVKGMVNTFLDDDQQNNFLANTNNFRLPVGLVKYEQAKNSIKYPFDYATELKPNATSSTEVGATAFNPSNLNVKSSGMGDSEVRLQFMRAVNGGRFPMRNSLSKGLTDKNLSEDYDETGAGTDGVGLNTVPDLLGIGCDYNNSVGQSQNYVNQDYELKVESGVQTGRTTLPASRRNKVEIQQTFIKNVSELNLQTLVKQQ